MGLNLPESQQAGLITGLINAAFSLLRVFSSRQFSLFSPIGEALRYVASWIKTFEVSGMTRCDATKESVRIHDTERSEEREHIELCSNVSTNSKVKYETSIFEIIKNDAVSVSCGLGEKSHIEKISIKINIYILYIDIIIIIAIFFRLHIEK